MQFTEDERDIRWRAVVQAIISAIASGLHYMRHVSIMVVDDNISYCHCDDMFEQWKQPQTRHYTCDVDVHAVDVLTPAQLRVRLCGGCEVYHRSRVYSMGLTLMSSCLKLKW
jgi:hypothetical protein